MIDLAAGSVSQTIQGLARARADNRLYVGRREGRIAVYTGATAALLVPVSGRIYLAIPSVNGQPAEIRIDVPAS